MKKRIVGCDAAKTIAMFFVVMLHYSFYTRYYSNGLAGTVVTVMCTVCVPLFFAVNGALLLPRPLDVSKHYHKTLNIIIIVIAWKIIASMFFVFVDRSHPVTFKDFLIFLLGGNFGEYSSGYFWFMNALISVYLIFPIVKLVFDAKNQVAINTLLAVLFGFTVGKDTLILLFQMLGTVAHHDFASVLSPIGDYFVFGKYGYVLLFFLVGGLIGEYLVKRQEGRKWVCNLLACVSSKGKIVAGIVICYIATLLIQRYQHVVNGTSLTVDNGYWLLPTFIAVLLILFALGKASFSDHCARFFYFTGANTFGVYMLHMAGLICLSKVQELSVFQVMGTMNSVALTIANVGLCICVYVVCLGISVLLRKIPYLRVLFSL